jgi:hypothetical protein
MMFVRQEGLVLPADTIGNTQHLLVTQALRERGVSSVDRKARPSSAIQGLAELKVDAVCRRSLNGDSVTLPARSLQAEGGAARRSCRLAVSLHTALPAPARRSALNSRHSCR